MDKKELKKELKNVDTIYVVGIAKGTNPRWDKGIWRKFKLFYIKDGILISIYPEKEFPPNWVVPHQTKSGNWIGGYFESKTLNMDRVFEIVYNFGKWLFGDGYKFKSIFLSG